MITQESFQEFISGAPNAVLVMLYSLSRYHEKFNLTKWCMDELIKRGFKKEDFYQFDTNFTNFYDQMLNQDDL